MRKHTFVWHATAREIVDTYFDGAEDGTNVLDENLGYKRRKPLLKRVRKEGMWGFVEVPVSSKRGLAIIHLWWRKNHPAEEVCKLVAHEIGHITGTQVTGMAEEDRANDYAAVARETIMVMMLKGKLSA